MKCLIIVARALRYYAKCNAADWDISMSVEALEKFSRK